MFVFYKHDKSSIYEENAIHYPFNGRSVYDSFCCKSAGTLAGISAGREIHTRKIEHHVVFYCGGYENTEILKLLDGYVDIYLPDYKYAESELAVKFSHANDYPERAMEAVNEMVRQTGMPQFDAEGYMKRGTIVRHLILPGHTRNSKKVLKLLHETFGKQIYISIMNQYTPVFEQKEYTELNRCVTRREYEKVLDYAFELGIENGFFQDGETARESFIPAFDYEGVRKMP